MSVCVERPITLLQCHLGVLDKALVSLLDGSSLVSIKGRDSESILALPGPISVSCSCSLQVNIPASISDIDTTFDDDSVCASSSSSSSQILSSADKSLESVRQLGGSHFPGCTLTISFSGMMRFE